ncbi:hypothetical protein P43SY_009609 [Pythium insidiosum]|uniref:Maspardin n=1 Tax=Pythium insidiosum TaxID=114742 RepID=A0AAD5M881_PYTIN|nr:hypothetical protein P43SY_009609 [Pythium insidiosum]
MQALTDSDRAFVQHVPRQRVTTYDGNTWEYFDCGKHSPQNAGLPPLVCLPGTSGSPRCFHLQLTALAAKGYRVLAVQHPVVWTHEEWIHSFDRFLDALGLEMVHIYGVSLGAYLAQRYASLYPHRVASLVMTQGFCDTSVFSANAPWLKMLPYLPDFYVRKLMLERFPKQAVRDPTHLQAIDYMVEQVQKLSQQEIASRLTLSTQPCDVASWSLSLPDDKITFIDAMIKSGGDFPFLSRHDEVTMYLQVHLRANGAFIVA